MFATLTTRFGSAMRLACRRFYTLQQRRDLILHLEPVEKLVRVLMIMEAITLLVMTPQGLKLRQTTKPCAIPEPPPQVGTHKQHPEADRIAAAMMTIAAHRPRIDPRVAEREAREAEQKRLAALELPAPALRRFRLQPPSTAASPSSTGSTTRRCAPRHQSCRAASILDDLTLTHSTRSRASPSIRPTKTEGRDLTGPLLHLARRIDALQRVIANPWPAIRRLARRIASIPREHFSAPWPRRYRAVRWAQGCREFYNACILAKPAFAALEPRLRNAAR